MPQSNPQAEIQNILTDVSSSLQNAPKRKMNKRWMWLITVLLLGVLALIIYTIIAKPKQQGLSEAEKIQILDYLEAETEPVPLTIEEKIDVVTALQQRAQ